MNKIKKTHMGRIILPEKWITTILIVFMPNILLISSENNVESIYYKNKKIHPKKECSEKPHIVFIQADDLGWNDVFWHNNDMYMPTLSELASNGVILEQYYALQVCVPSRAAFTTGLYPFKFGFQRGVPSAGIPFGLMSNMSKLPEKLKELDYRTYLVGKYHLGFCKEEYTPHGIGYDHFFGYYTGDSDNWFTHIKSESRDLNETFVGFDLRNEKSLVEDKETYLELLLREKAVKFIKEIPKGEPMFLLYASHIAHTPYQVPPKFVNLFKSVEDEKRRILCAMVAWLDESVLSIVNALKERGMWDNTLFIFASDNGAEESGGGDNTPLRGGKGFLYEGGTRLPAFVYGNALKKTGYKNQRLMHAVDWFNTLIHFAGGTIDKRLDSLDMWSSIVNDRASPRQEMVYNLDVVLPCWNRDGECAAIRIGDYKLFVVDYDVSITPNVDRVLKAINEKKLKLFNLKSDPNEELNIANEKFVLVYDLLRKLKEYSKEVVYPLYNVDGISGSVESNPNLFGGAWSPGWC